MNTLKKIIFLSNNEKNKGMGILKLERKNNNIFGTIKTYQNKFDGEYILGLKVEDKIIKQNVKLDNNIYSFVISEKVDLCNTIACVLLKCSQNEFTPVIWGSEKNYNYKSAIISNLKESVNKLKSSTQQKANVKNLTSTPIEDKELFSLKAEEAKQNTNQDDESLRCNSKLIQGQIPMESSVLNTPITNHSNYQELSTSATQEKNVVSELATHANQNINESLSQIAIEPEEVYPPLQSEIAVASSKAMLFEDNEEEVENIIDNEITKSNNTEHKFYNMISDQLEEIFERYPKETNLMSLIDNSTWVKIDSDIDNKYYVVGIILHNNAIKYICYGVPGTYNQEPPIEMREYSQWLPTDVKDPYRNGYWVMYQDADTGENIFIN